MERILVIAAHPDDEVLGCGATISKMRGRGTAIRVLFLGEGSSCRYPADQVDSPAARDAIAARTSKAHAALDLLDVSERTFLDLSCGRFDQANLIDIGKAIESQVTDFRPDTVLTHSNNDVHNDHRIAFQATLQATRPGGQNMVDTVLSYEVLSSSEWRFIETFMPNFFVEIGEDDVKRKLAAMRAYDSEVRPFPFPRSDDAIQALATLRGSQISCRAAEAFTVVRTLHR